MAIPNMPSSVYLGFDKSGESPLAFLKMGYGFVEIGTVTPFPQEGNPLPRIFRLPQDKAVINRCGFNNVGVEKVARRLREISRQRWRHDLSRFGVIGVSLGKNKDSTTPVWDYSETARRVAPYADYLVINVSSPNTSGLRALQKKSELTEIVCAVKKVLNDLMDDVEKQKKATLARVKVESPDIKAAESTFRFCLPTLTGKRPPIFIKIACMKQTRRWFLRAPHLHDCIVNSTQPDITEEDMDGIAEVVLKHNVDGMIICNTTVTRPETLGTTDKELINQAGGLSGTPLRDLSTRLVFEMYKRTKGKVPIIAVGGISNGRDALEKIEAGASAIQIYTAMIYDGPGVTRRIKRQLSSLMYSKGYRSLEDAVAAAHREIHSNSTRTMENGTSYIKQPQRKLRPPTFDG